MRIVLILQKFSALDVSEDGKEFDVLIDLRLGKFHGIKDRR